LRRFDFHLRRGSFTVECDGGVAHDLLVERIQPVPCVHLTRESFSRDLRHDLYETESIYFYAELFTWSSVARCSANRLIGITASHVLHRIAT
jgi:hypothetical protein